MFKSIDQMNNFDRGRGPSNIYFTVIIVKIIIIKNMVKKDCLDFLCDYVNLKIVQNLNWETSPSLSME